MAMESRALRLGLQRAIHRSSAASQRQCCLSYVPAWKQTLPVRKVQPVQRSTRQSRHFHCTPTRKADEDADLLEEDVEEQPSRPKGRGNQRGEDRKTRGKRERTPAQLEREKAEEKRDILDGLRVLPASPSYFTAQPQFTDDILRLEALVRKYTTYPAVAPSEAQRISWITYQQYTQSSAEPIRNKRYNQLIKLLQRLNQIHPAVKPADVTQELERWKRAVQPSELARKPQVLDQWGRSRAMGRRKTSSAVVWLVEGDGQVRVNGRTLTEMFSRLHDRESAVWALKATARMDKYNVWATVEGGGTTGQAEAMTLGLARALMVHEPALKPALRRAGCVTRDHRVVERKKAGKLKARKMPAWVKR